MTKEIDESTHTDVIHHGVNLKPIREYCDRCIESIVPYLKEKQREHKYGSNARNVLRHLEVTLPNLLKEQIDVNTLNK